MNKKLNVTVSALLIAAMALSPAAFAGNGNGKGAGNGGMPPGLESKFEEGKLPPGHVKKLTEDALEAYFGDYPEIFEKLPKGIAEKLDEAYQKDLTVEALMEELEQLIVEADELIEDSEKTGNEDKYDDKKINDLKDEKESSEELLEELDELLDELLEDLIGDLLTTAISETDEPIVAELNDQVEALEDAIKAVTETKTEDVEDLIDELEALIIEAEELYDDAVANEDDYSSLMTRRLSYAIDDSYALLDEVNPTMEELNTQIEALQTAMDNLTDSKVKDVEYWKDELSDLIDAANIVFNDALDPENEGLYDTDLIEALEDEIDLAVIDLNDADITITELKSRLDSLEKAVDELLESYQAALEEKKNELRDLIDIAEDALVEAANPSTDGTYGIAERGALFIVVLESEALLEEEDLTEAMIDDQIAILDEAITDLLNSYVAN